MKTKKILKLNAFILFFAFSAFQSNAQLPATVDIATIKISQMDDYFQAYFEPFAKATAFTMGGGWYNTASTHKLLGFDITLIGFSGAMIPEEALVASSQDINLGDYLQLNPSGGDIPTLSASKDIAAPTIQASAQGYSKDLFSLSGHGVKFSGALNMFQVGIGLPKGTDLKVRYLPTINQLDAIGLNELGLWGVGIQHDLKQWIPVVNKVPIVEISAAFGYSKFTAGYSGFPFPLDPTFFGGTSSLPAATWDDQSLSFDVSSLVGNLVIGAKLPVFHPYISVGFNKASFDGGFKGTFPVLTLQGNTSDLSTSIVAKDSEIDPLLVEVNETMMNFAAGFRLKLAVITISGQYTLQEYPMVSAGVGISFR